MNTALKRLLPSLVLFAVSSTQLTIAQTQLEEVLVTAQKREQRLMEIPLSVSVISGDSIRAGGLATLSNIATEVPNFQTASPLGDVLPIFSIRGVSMADYSTNQSSPVGVYLDEVHLSANYTHGLPLFDLERIEVLRGPQGTLYGKNTTGGAINLISKTPDFVADGYASIAIGNYDAYSIKAAYEAPLIDNVLAARLAISTDNADGYSRNHVPGAKDLSATDRESARLSVQYQPTDKLSALLKLSYGNSDPETTAVIPVTTGPGGATLLGYSRPANYDGFDTDSNRVDDTSIKTSGASLVIHWEREDYLLTSVTGYYKGDYLNEADSDGTPQELLENDYGTDVKQWSQDLRISSLQTTPFAYTVGIYFSKEEYETQNIYRFFHGLESIAPLFDPNRENSGFTLGQRYEQERISQAIYGHMSYALSDRLNVTTGLRYNKDKNKQFNVHTYAASYDEVPVYGLIPSTDPYDPNTVYPSDSFTDNELTGTLKADYTFNDQLMVYASYSRGYRSGAFNGAAVFGPAELVPVDPEYVNAFEIGAKGKFFDNRIEYLSALFHYDYRNQQFINIDNALQVLNSADRSSITGLDIEFKAQVSDNLRIDLGIGLIDSEYDELELQGSDLSGNQLIAAPDININLMANYRIDLNSGTLNAQANINFIDDQWFSAFNDDAGYQNIGQSNYTLANVRLEYTPTQSNMSAALWIKNVTDKEYKTYGINLTDNFGYNYTMVGAPRTYGAEIRFAF